MQKSLNRRRFLGGGGPPTVRGVSLIEALIAMAVMSFGMLAVVGVQTTLRMNADIARQRFEATRIADEEMERLRSFIAIAATGGATLEWDEIGSNAAAGVAAAPTESNTTFTVKRVLHAAVAGSAQKMVTVEVTWVDRFGVDGADAANITNRNKVILRSIIAGAAPVLSGLLSVPPTATASSQRSNRHPTIPPRSKDLGAGESVFKPAEGGTVAWTFNNTTGVITNVCTVSNLSTTSSLVAGDLTTCSATTAQLLAGSVRFNLRGASRDLADGTSVIKPIPGGTVAWVINHATQRIVRNCQVAAASTTASLLPADVVGASCTVVSQPVAPFDAVNDPIYSLLAVDSEDPLWPALPLAMSLSLSSAGHASAPTCYTNSPVNSLIANVQIGVEYFCIVFPNAVVNWSGTTSVVGQSYADGGAAAWSSGTSAGLYRICRYTLAATDTTQNIDHPRSYASVGGNLINQNFLVIAGTKICPTDVAANPAAGNFVNSNTLDHQH